MDSSVSYFHDLLPKPGLPGMLVWSGVERLMFVWVTVSHGFLFKSAHVILTPLGGGVIPILQIRKLRPEFPSDLPEVLCSFVLTSLPPLRKRIFEIKL